MRGGGIFELADIEKNAQEGKKGKPLSRVDLQAVRRLGYARANGRAFNCNQIGGELHIVPRGGPDGCHCLAIADYQIRQV